jgi:hypothetical protein
MENPRGEKRKPLLTPGERVAVDEAGRVRDWFDLRAPPLGTGAVEDAARGLLKANAQAFGWGPDLADLRTAATLGIGGIRSARFRQEHKGIPVVSSEVVVNVHGDRPHSIYNQYRYGISQGLGKDAVRFDSLHARRAVAELTRMFKHRIIGPARLVIYPFDDHGQTPRNRSKRPRRARAAFVRMVQRRLRRSRNNEKYALAWELRVATRSPLGRWRVQVGAISGRVIDVRDEIAYATGSGKIFDPNPIVTSGDSGLSSKTAKRVLNAERRSVQLANLDPRGTDGRYRLDGAGVIMEELEEPAVKEPSSRNAKFSYSWNNRKFLDVMAYFHIERFHRYLLTDLGLDDLTIDPVAVDCHALEGEDDSQCTGTEIYFGEKGIPDASDGMVVLHEYGHVIQESILPGSSTGNSQSGFSEGFPDFLAAVYYDDKHKNPGQTRGLMFSWNCNPTDGFLAGRTYDLPDRFDDPAWPLKSAYEKAAVWCSVMFELYRKLGGDSTDAATRAGARDLAIRLHLTAHAGIPAAGATLTQMIQQLEAADANLGGWRPADGLHLKLIRDTFARRGAPGYPTPAVDVYVFDGREGGYGSPDGFDRFGDVLWKADFGNTPDIWVAAQPNAAAPAVPPASGQTAHLFVRVKNRGRTASGAVTVRAFLATGGAKNWPGDWTAIDPAVPALVIADVPSAPGPGVVAGPFKWVPQAAGNHSILIILECAADPALTQGLPAGVRVPYLDIVPFDNNIAVRDFLVAR